MSPQYPKTWLRSRLTKVLEDFAPVKEEELPELKLFTNDYSPGPLSQASDFTVPTYAGYSAEQIVMSPVMENDFGMVVSISQNMVFRPTNSATSTTVYGVFVVDGDGSLVSAQRFDEPQVLNTPLDFISGVWRLSEPLSGYSWKDTEM